MEKCSFQRFLSYCWISYILFQIFDFASNDNDTNLTRPANQLGGATKESFRPTGL